MRDPLTLVVLLHIQEGRREDFEAFEQSAAAIMRRHGGRIERRLLPRPAEGQQARPPMDRPSDREVDSAADPPDEVHLVTFPGERQFRDYLGDPELETLQDLRARAIRRTVVWPAAEAPAFPGSGSRARDASSAADTSPEGDASDEGNPSRSRSTLHPSLDDLSATSPILYDELAGWWPLLSAPADYEEEAAFYADTLEAFSSTPPRTLLELGSGGGNNASHLKERFERVTLVDLSPGMLEVSRTLNPECEHRVGDMRSVRLEREFDAVFVHDAICYVTSLPQLRQVVDTAHVHCRSGGAALFAPDFVRESFSPSTDHGGEGRATDARALRYLEWTWDPDPDDHSYVVDYAYLLREPDGRIDVRHDRHLEGLFSIEEWSRTLSQAGFDPHVVKHRHMGPAVDAVAFVGTRS